MDGWMEGETIGGWMDGWMDGWVDGWMDEQTGREMNGGTTFWRKTPLVPGQLTIDPQPKLQLCAACHVGRHAAVTPGIRKSCPLNADNSPVS